MAGTQRAPRHSSAVRSLPTGRGGWQRADGPRWNPPSSRSSVLSHARGRCACSVLFSRAFNVSDTESHFLAPGASHCRLFRLQTPPPSPPCGVFFTWEYYPKPEMRAFHQERPIRGMTLIQRRYENDKCHHAGLHETADIRPFLISGKKGQPHRKVWMLLLVSFFGDP